MSPLYRISRKISIFVQVLIKLNDFESASARRRSGRRKPGHEPRKRGLDTKLHPGVDAHGMPLRAIVTQGTAADCSQAVALIDGIAARYLLADRGYDTDDILRQARERGMPPVIPPKRNRKAQREYDRHLYQARHLVENAFLHPSGGAASQPGMQRTPPRSLPPSIFGAFFCGLLSCDYTSSIKNERDL